MTDLEKALEEAEYYYEQSKESSKTWKPLDICHAKYEHFATLAMSRIKEQDEMARKQSVSNLEKAQEITRLNSIITRAKKKSDSIRHYEIFEILSEAEQTDKKEG